MFGTSCLLFGGGAVLALGAVSIFIVPRLSDRAAAARVARAKADLSNMHAQVKLFQADQGFYPAMLSELVTPPAGVKSWPPGGYLPALTPDPWGNSYGYRVSPAGAAPFEIFTLGADGVPGGKGEDGDLSVP